MLKNLTDRDAVLSAMREFDRGRRDFLRRHKYRSATEFLVEHDGRFYDSKAIAGVAFGYQFSNSGPLKPNQFTGGEATVKRKLEELGFSIARIADYERRHHFLLKLNVDGTPHYIPSESWENRDLAIEPVQLSRGGDKIVPTPPPLTPWSRVFIWANAGGDDGGIVATATVDDVLDGGARCRLNDAWQVDPFGFSDLAEGTTKELRHLYQDLDSNRRSKVRYLPRATWESLESLIRDYRRKNVLGPHRTCTGVMALTLNQQAHGHRIGNLQTIRSQIHNTRKVGTTIFSAKSVKERYAFHSGGREELQFNIGEEGPEEEERFRWGVAFSFEPSRSFPDPSVLAAKVRYFNDYIEQYGSDIADMTMWRYEGKEGPIDMGPPQPIPTSLVRNHVFIFLGKHDSSGGIDSEWVLNDFDRLLPLYEYVESKAAVTPEGDPQKPFIFKAGHRKKARKAKASTVARELEMDLRHEAIQEALYEHLAKIFGRHHVGTEQVCTSGKRIDAVVRSGNEYWLYEIKTSSSPRACIREALGQLLEYCLWPGGLPGTRLVVVGETPLDSAATAYLASLNAQLSIPLEYMAVRAAP